MQAGFIFDAPLEAIPASQLPPPREEQDKVAFVERLRAVLPGLPDDIDIDAPLLALGLDKHELTGWHRSRALEALIDLLAPVFQAYRTSDGKFRYRRLPPLELCPGFGDQTCSVKTRGGVRCPAHLAVEEEDLWNQD